MADSELRPTPEVAEELRELLRRNQSRLGDTFRGLEEGKTHRQIADALGVPTHGFGYNNQATIEAIFDGRRSDAPVPTRVTRSRVASLLKHAVLSTAARDYLSAVLAELDAQALPASGWDDFVRWAELVVSSADLVHTEDEWKRKVARGIGQALEELSVGTPEALHSAKVQLARSGLLDSFFIIQLGNAESGDPDGFAELLASTWATEPSMLDLDDFADDLRVVVHRAKPEGRRVTPGDATALASLLLMARDPSRYPPYRRRLRVRSRDSAGSRPARAVTQASAAASSSTGSTTSSTRLGAARLTSRIGWPPKASHGPSPRAARRLGITCRPGGEFTGWRGDPTEPQRAWLMRPAQGGSGRWLDEGFVSLPATHLGHVEPGADLAAVKAAVNEGYTAQDYAQRQALTKEYHAFLSLVAPDDLVVVQTGGDVTVGTVTSDPEYRDEEGYRLARDVTWAAEAASEALAPPLPSLLDLQGNVVEITQGLAALRLLIVDRAVDGGSGGTSDGDDGEVVATSDAVPQLPAATSQLATRLHTRRQRCRRSSTCSSPDSRSCCTARPAPARPSSPWPWHATWSAPRTAAGSSSCSSTRPTPGEDFIEGFRPVRTDEDRRPSNSSRARCGASPPRPARTPANPSCSSSTSSTAPTWPRCSASSTSCWNTAISGSTCSTSRTSRSACRGTCSSSAP